MSITDTITLTFLVTGGLSLYLVVRAAVDLYRNGLPEQRKP